MGAGLVGGGSADTEGFEVVVPGEVGPEAHHAVGDVAVEARRFAVVVGEVFSELAVEVVGREQGVVECAGQAGRDGEVNKPGVSVTPEGGMMVHDAGVVWFFIGDEDEGGLGLRGLEGKAALEHVAKGTSDGAAFEREGGIEGFCLCLLRFTHGA